MSNSTCANCGARMSCGCQRRQATNGASACSTCVASLNARLAAETSATNPTSIKPVWGANRYKKL
jgi:hypothetical protein